MILLFYFCTVPTAAPQMPSGSPLTSTLISITWAPPPDEHINGVIDIYLVEVTEVVTNNTWTFHALQTQVNVGPLHPYYMYRCRVTASTIGPGPYTPFFYVYSGEASMLYIVMHRLKTVLPQGYYNCVQLINAKSVHVNNCMNNSMKMFCTSSSYWCSS